MQEYEMSGKAKWSRRSFLAMSTAVATVGSIGARAQGNPDLKIGVVASLTGPNAAFGRDYAEGLTAYVKAWNGRGGHKGRKIALDTLDDETNPVNAINAFRKHASDPATSVIWCAVGSQTALGIKALASEFKVPVVSGGGIDELGIPADPWFFKVSQGQSDLTAAFMVALKRRQVKTLATLNATDATGQSDARKVREMAGPAGIKIVAAESFATTDTNFNVQLVHVRNSKADLFWNQASGGPAILVFKQVKQLQIEMPMVVSFAAVNNAFFQGIGGPEQAEGIMAIIPYGVLAADDSGPVGAMYKEASAALGKPAGLFQTIGWDTAIVTEDAANRSNGSREGIRTALDEVKDLPAINGPFTFSPQNHIGQDIRGLVLARFTNKRWSAMS
jgi:branched-chain amino acid transport system substrate-binding protein